MFKEEIQTNIQVCKSTDHEEFMNKVNFKIHELEREKCEIVDVKYSSATKYETTIEYSCMIIFKCKHYRWKDEI